MNKLKTKGDRNIVAGKSKQKGAKESLGRVQKEVAGIRAAIKKSASGRCE